MKRLYQFPWEIPECGYEIFQDPEGKSFLVERMDAQKPLVRYYQPLEEVTGLFIEFASLHPLAGDKAVAFANQYGCLGQSSKVNRVPPDSDAQTTDMREFINWQFGESLEEWTSLVAKMHHLHRLWKAARDKDRTVLEQYIHWYVNPETGNHEAVFYRESRPLGSFRRIAEETENVSYRVDLLGDFARGDLVKPAYQTLQDELNARLKLHPLQPLLTREAAVYASMSLCQVPPNLLGALWLQFAMAIAGNSLYRQCDHCRRWFEIGFQGGDRRVRDDAKFCKPACRSRAYRERKKRAQQLFDSGSSLQTIVKELDSDLETVKGWTNKKRKGGT
jgi:hypothetical protein